MRRSLTRRGIMRASLAATLAARFKPAAAQSVPLVFGYPVGHPDRVFGDGFLVRHGYATENTWYLPGYLHAGEDWYTTEGDAAGAGVYAAAAGEVVFAGSDYPGRVVIVRHADDLFSMYGHLDYALAVEAETSSSAGSRLARFWPGQMVVLPAIFISRFGPFLRRPRSTGMPPATASPAASTVRLVPATGRSTRRSIRRSSAGATRPTSSIAAPGRTAFRKGRGRSWPRRARDSSTLWIAPRGAMTVQNSLAKFRRLRPAPSSLCSRSRPGPRTRRNECRGLPPLVPHRAADGRRGLGPGRGPVHERHRLGRPTVVGAV